ncbi:hypothetical protein QVD17_12970 [Tagetes erecta]|uniref:Uncharacterized protein n=1 Tax=Tagetes erecta TaxID=13708 RepID=A0AAD8L012_TARER|nr:hypothetical protein QVD17_12970 [Tagetes erecta]
MVKPLTPVFQMVLLDPRVSMKVGFSRNHRDRDQAHEKLSTPLSPQIKTQTDDDCYCYHNSPETAVRRRKLQHVRNLKSLILTYVKEI